MIDAYGSLQGIVTQTNFLEAIAGDLPEAQTEEPEVKELADGSLLIDGGISIYDAQQRVGLDMLSAGDFNTLAGLVLRVFGRIPAVGERIDWRGWSFEVSDMRGWRINKVLARRVGADG